MLRSRPNGIAAIVPLAMLLAGAFWSCASPPLPQPNESPPERASSPDKPGGRAVDQDRALLQAATSALGDREGAVLVMDPHTGRLRAVVNPRLAFEQAFPPGSTIKNFTTLIALRAGLIDAETRSQCRGSFKRDDFQITCSHPKSKTPFNVAQALAYSCNVFFAGLSERLGPAAFRATLAAFGFGERTGVNAEESAGSISAGEWRVEDGVGEGGALLVTPIQLLTAYAALFNGGHLLRPRLTDADQFKPEERATLPIDDRQRSILLEGCRGAVEYGTAADARLGSLPFFAFGKTGTAVASNEFRRYGWFVCFAADQPDARGVPSPESLKIEVLVFLKRGHGWQAAAVAKKLLEDRRWRSEEMESGIEDGGSGIEYSLLNRPSPIVDFPSSILYPRPSNQTIRVRLLREHRTLTMPLEEYLLGVMAVEASVEDEIEALKAQALISRTYALKNLGRHAREGYDLCSNTHCQQFVRPNRAAMRQSLIRAVSETAGQVLADERGRLVDAYFHAACGGMTANIEALWGVPAPSYLRGVRDDYCLTGPHRNWSDRIKRDRLLRALRTDARSDVGASLDDIVVTKRDGTGRVERIALEGEHRRELRGWDFKLIVGRALGWNVLKSSRFEVTRRGSTFIFRGSGFGHGLGLCQEGAHVMARRGAGYRQVLSFYFPKTRVETASSAGAAKSIVGNSEPGALKEASFTSPEPASLNVALRLASAPLQPLGGVDSPKRFLSSEHFRVGFPVRTDSMEIEAVLRVLEAARTGMSRRIAAAALRFIDEPIEVMIHSTTQDFVAATGQPWFAAGATRAGRIQLQPLDVLKRRRIVESTLRHEYAHCVIDSIGGQRCARWLVEGLAIHLAGEGLSFRQARRAKEMPLDALERGLEQPGSSAEMRTLYAAAYQRVAGLIKSEGEAVVLRSVSGCADNGVDGRRLKHSSNLSRTPDPAANPSLKAA